MLFSPVFAEHHPGLFTLPAARRSLQSRRRICSLRFSSTAFLFAAHYQLLTIHSSARSHGIISFTDPHPLTLLKSYRFKNRGGRVYPLGPQVLLLSKLKPPINRAESTLLQVFFLKNLKPFEINTYEKQREGSPLWLTIC